jgi:hypothetical protein
MQSTLSKSLALCVSLSFFVLWQNRYAKSFFHHQANKVGNRLETSLNFLKITIIMAIEVHQ